MAVAALAGLAMTASPLLGVHGVESALVLGILLPPFTAAAGARYVHAVRQSRAHERASRLLGRAAGAALVVLAIPVGLLALNSLRVRSCTPAEGLAFVALGPGLGVVLSASMGVVLAAWIPRPRLSTTLAVLLPVSAIAFGLWRFWASPAIFVYQHFVGWFPGTLYDEGVVIPTSYLSFRAMTIAIVAAIGLLLSATWDPGVVRARLGRLLGAPARTGAGLTLLLGVMVADAWAPELGHAADPADMARQLGATLEGERCTVHAPRELPPAELERLRDDCDYRVRIAEADLGVRQRERVTAFLFRSADEKRRLMGAAHTYIAKPWRNEVYLQLRGWPHPVLGHEIVHVVAANAADGPFRVGGRLGGWLPDPALIEGVAVAVAWDAHDGLTPHQWARALRELDMMPPLERVVGLSFLGEPPRNAYTVAGSFIRYVMDTYGAAPVRRAYRTGDVAAAVGKSIDELEIEWHEFLEGVELPREGLALAELRFSRRSIFSAVCPHEVARLRQELGEDLAAGDARRAATTCEEILDIDPNDVVSRARCVGAHAWLGSWDGALGHLGTLTSEPPAPAPVRVMAMQSLADAAWRRGDTEEALRIYRELLDEPQADDAARQIEVKVLGLTAGRREAELVFDLLVGNEAVPASAPVAVHLARELSAVRPDGLGPYLEARQLAGAGRYDLALPALRAAQDRRLPTRRLRIEARRLEALALFATGRLDASVRLWRAVLGDPEAREGDRVDARDWLRRIRMRR